MHSSNLGTSLKEFILPLLITFSNSIKNLVAWWRELSDSQKYFIQVTAVMLSLGPINTCLKNF